MRTSTIIALSSLLIVGSVALDQGIAKPSSQSNLLQRASSSSPEHVMVSSGRGRTTSYRGSGRRQILAQSLPPSVINPTVY